MKIFIVLFLTLSLAACVPQAKTNTPKASTSTGSGSSGQSSSFFATDTFQPNSNGTGNGSILGTGTGSGSDVVIVPTPTPEPTPSLTEYCGKLYISKAGTVMFIDEDEHYRVIDPDTYNAEQVVNNITFPNDAFNACVHGNLTSGRWIPIIRAEFIQLAEIIVNPERVDRKSDYSHEICGTIMYKQDAGKPMWIQIQVGTSYKIVDDPTNTVKDYLDANGNTHGGLYNNAGFTNNFYVTYKQYFKPADFDLGW